MGSAMIAVVMEDLWISAAVRGIGSPGVVSLFVRSIVNHVKLGQGQQHCAHFFQMDVHRSGHQHVANI